MSRIFIIGATGGIASRLIPKLTDAGHQISGLHRKPEQADTLRQQGVDPVAGDIMDMSSDDFTKATRDHDVIVFSAGAAGSGPERTRGIDGDGVKKAIAAAEANGIRRFYLISVFMDAGRDRPRKDGFELYMATKREADNALVAADLDWVIVRPGTLEDDDGDGQINANRAIPYGPVARGNVAALLAELIDTPDFHHEIVEVTNGSTPVKDAVRKLER